MSETMLVECNLYLPVKVSAKGTRVVGSLSHRRGPDRAVLANRTAEACYTEETAPVQ
jgi:hypothetical protein